MIIYLYLDNKIITFRLPNQVIGSYSFDEFDSEEDKLINIDALENEWVLYSTKSSKIVSGENFIQKAKLKDNMFFVLQRNKKNYLIYVTNGFNDNNTLYSFDEKLNLVVGNSGNCNVIYPVGVLNGISIKLHYVNGVLVLEKEGKRPIYINEIAFNGQSTRILSGSNIDMYGLKLYIFKNLILINNPGGILKLNMDSCNIKPYFMPEFQTPENIEIKDIDLYDKDDYYLKSPRIRRLIEPQKVKLSTPPKTEEEKSMPLILTLGPMFTMGIISVVTVVSTISKIASGEATLASSITSLITAGAMLLSMILWPLITNFYNKKVKKKKLKEDIEKYEIYLNEKRNVLETESKTQRDILNENLISTEECLVSIQNKNMNFWNKRIDQNDFLNVRIGKGSVPLEINLEYQQDDFILENNELRKKIDAMIDEFKNIDNVPIGYSFLENYITAIMGSKNKSLSFVDNILLQLLSFYTYEDLKVVVFTDTFNKDRWQYVKYLNHNFNNSRDFRFFSSDYESAKVIMDYLSFELNNRMATKKDGSSTLYKPNYFIIVDGYDQVKRFDFIKQLTEADSYYGFSLVILEEKMGNLPSKCSNFITIGQKNSGILKNSYEKQEKIDFTDEINDSINMLEISEFLSNIPIEFEEGIKQLPNSISFLEMEKVGKVEQLNILNRWNTNDPTTSLKAEIGVDENNELIYLDLHEKFHGPHGLIAGMTGSGKSEFIITYILSLAVNYSPDDVSFILIDYKGGGLAFAFENKKTGISLPHLAGTITNLDKAEMDRTLVSIDSEIKRRQQIFNDARDKLGESTIDIYKYQRFYKEGKLEEPVSHLFIICDEFAELKTQQPEFMDNLISVARIGRSLGVHLILATQKPSGVVNDQIWSNTKFRVCLKVQDESDSKEMLKRPEAASLKQTGRFYLQVGYDELFLLGQSGWCGAKYYPSDKIVKQVDKSINFINECGNIIRSIEAGSNQTVQSQGEQLSSILNNIVEVSKISGKKTNRLWLENIPEIVLVDDLEAKYSVKYERFNPVAIIGEYDAPEMQEQGIVKYDFLNDGNTIIYGMDGSEREKLLDSIIYSSTKNYSTDEINYYIVDYGSESFRKYAKLPHLGGLVFAQEEEKYHNLFKLLKEEMQKRKKLFADFGGEYKNYIENSVEKLPLYVVVLNNYDSIYDSNPNVYEELPDVMRDSERYGIVFIITGNAVNSVQSKISQNCNNIYSLKLKDSSDYSMAFGKSTKIIPRNINGRGLFKLDSIHEFQTASIVENEEEINQYTTKFIDEQISKNGKNIHKIPTLPDIVRYNDVISCLNGLASIPIGIEKNELNICTVDYTANVGNIITSNKLANIEKFAKSLIFEFSQIKGFNTIIFDANNNLKLNKEMYPNYFNSNLDSMLKGVNSYLLKLIDSHDTRESVILIYGLDKFLTKLEDKELYNNLLENVKKYEHSSVIIIDDVMKIKKYNFDTWFTSNFNTNDGVWIGRGISDQNLLHLATITKEMTVDLKNNMGYYISEGVGVSCKFIDFVTEEDNEK